jgi:hypothetical protein
VIDRNKFLIRSKNETKKKLNFRNEKKLKNINRLAMTTTITRTTTTTTTTITSHLSLRPWLVEVNTSNSNEALIMKNYNTQVAILNACIELVGNNDDYEDELRFIEFKKNARLQVCREKHREEQEKRREEKRSRNDGDHDSDSDYEEN